jgi:2-oxoglutarate dehydrogenase E1 component
MTQLRDEFHGPNYAYLMELYERYRSDPRSLNSQMREFFDSVSISHDGRSADALDAELAIQVSDLAAAIRKYGYLRAALDPLGGEPPGDPDLELEAGELSWEDVGSLPAQVVGAPVPEDAKHAAHAIDLLRDIYMGRIGYDYGHIREPKERDWLQTVAESGRFRPPEYPVDGVGLLERLTQIEVFEQYLHRIFPGKTRFSIEGTDMLIPMLDQLVGGAVDTGMAMMFIGMAHRGRLNVLAHILGKPYETILAEFKDPGMGYMDRYESGWTGDVKYHKGKCVSVAEDEQGELTICMPPNPSHLEHVNPVVEGMARARGESAARKDRDTFQADVSLPVLVHGDASFPGQGIVSETLNLSRLPGYGTGGTIHIIVDNQLGFTATAEESRSTLYASDLAKGFKVPIIHVNADDPIACIEAARTSFAYRARFHRDFVIHLLGYRRYGHNEGDEPSFTQPVMYDMIRDHPSVRAQWAEQLVSQGEIRESEADGLIQAHRETLQERLDQLEAEERLPHLEDSYEVTEEFPSPDTAFALDELREIHSHLLETPEGFNLHPKLERFMGRRRDMMADEHEANVDWASAESLAFGSILREGTSIRLSGEDVIRGTFNQRHAAFYDVETGEPYFPLDHLPESEADFNAWNSPLTEAGVLAFEYGYDLQGPDHLVIWEAQYGDFINGAQVIVDEFLVSARAKWGQQPALVLLLPHGNEGQGPDHSSARPERFLQMASNGNLQVAVPSTAAQFFHLLRRQAKLLEDLPLPLIVLTPKGLLRHPRVASSADELARGHWRAVIDDPLRAGGQSAVRRVILCSGRVWVDLISSDDYQDAEEISVVRLEQLYPFPGEALDSVVGGYGALEEVWWVQEEPRNMGAWPHLQEELEAIVDGRGALVGLTRSGNSSPAEGSTAWYRAVQDSLIEAALTRPSDDDLKRVTLEGE